MALQDEQLQQNLRHTLGQSLHSRDVAVAEVSNWEALRDYARAAKVEALSDLGGYLEQLESAVETNGGRVIWAETARQAVEFILDLAHGRELRRVVKSKSMLGEEIGLNRALEQWLEVVETDLGEYIVQLLDQRPSHIVAPALHLSRRQVAELFEDKFEMRPGGDVEEITATARTVLRRHFLRAHLGITGVNFGVAETGTLVVVENEGNARLTLSAPPFHVAIMGIEKVIPRMTDLSVFLKLLTRSATGQKITSYVNLVQGARREEERDGPREFYLILVDNGRSRILEDPKLAETLACIRCGACQNVCPVYQQIGGHAYGSTYQGPIGAILTPQLESPREAPEHPFVSSLCGACREVCPVKIEIPEILLRLRQRVQQSRGASASHPHLERWAFRLWSWIASDPERYSRCSRWARRFWHWKGPSSLVLAEKLLPPLREWKRERTIPAVPERSFREIFGATERLS